MQRKRFWKNWTNSFRGCSITVAKVEMYPYTLACSRFVNWLGETCSHYIIDFLMKLFRTGDVCYKVLSKMFHFELPSITLRRRLEKFEIEHCNVETVLIRPKFVSYLRYYVYVRIYTLCLPVLCVYVFYYAVNKDEYKIKAINPSCNKRRRIHHVPTNYCRCHQC